MRQGKGGPPGTNRTKLQAIIALSVVRAPAGVRLDASDADEPLEITIEARITQSARPSEPLTLSAWRNLFQGPESPQNHHGGGTIAAYIAMRSVTDPAKGLPLAHPSSAVRVHWKFPAEDDWREVMEFVTIPAENSGESLRVTRILERKWLLQGATKPEPGEQYRLSVNADCFVAWWNWGSLDGALKDAKLVHVPSPAISDRKDSELKPNEILSYGAWEVEDDEGNEMVYLDFEAGGEGPAVQIV